MGFVLCDFHLRLDKRILLNIKSCQNCHCLLYRRHADIKHLDRFRPWALRKDSTYIVHPLSMQRRNNSYILESASLVISCCRARKNLLRFLSYNWIILGGVTDGIRTTEPHRPPTELRHEWNLSLLLPSECSWSTSVTLPVVCSCHWW
jgi:hypothetical protein